VNQTGKQGLKDGIFEKIHVTHQSIFSCRLNFDARR
jgi:hypothetical protein